MGLDVAFDYNRAVKCGMEIDFQTNGSEEEAIEAREEGNIGYAEWLEKTERLCRVRGMEHKGEPYWVSCSEGWSEDDEGNRTDLAIVRANKWGSTYEPLTQFLLRNNIEWTEG